MATDLGMNFAPQVGIATTSTSVEPDDLIAVGTTRGSAKSGYTLWAFDGAQWKLTKDRSASGYVASPPPTTPGRFKGQVRAILSVTAE